MTDHIEVIREAVPSHEAAADLIKKLFDTARPENVFGQPVEQGGYAAIPASEIIVGMGFGYGGGAGLGKPDIAGGTESAAPDGGAGAGGGGGGGTMARPVAVISIGPAGVHVEPIVDVTKVVLAFFTAFGAMWMMFERMRRASQEP